MPVSLSLDDSGRLPPGRLSADSWLRRCRLTRIRRDSLGFRFAMGHLL
jgi:hypothetical protein